MKRFGGLMVWIAALAAVSGTAKAQILYSTASGGGPLACRLGFDIAPVVRAEGYAERVGDLTIICTGGGSPTPGAPVPTVRISVFLNTHITSRVFGNGLSEALLLIDDPGATSGYDGPGTTLPQTLCSGGATGAGSGGCETYAQTTATTSKASTCTAISGGVCTAFGPTPNVFQGVVHGSNEIRFEGIPILAPVTSGYARMFRITNIRANAAAVAGSAGVGVWPIYATASMVGPFSVVGDTQPVANAVYALGGQYGGSVRKADNTGSGTSINVQQCTANGLTPGAVLRFPEYFRDAFRTRILATTSLSGAGTPPFSQLPASGILQNVPGTAYFGSESGFVFPVGVERAGLSNFGTRLKATFSNVPAGVGIYVSTANINPRGAADGNLSITAAADLTGAATAIQAGNFAAVTGSVSLLAGLVSDNPLGGSLPLLSATTTSGGVRLYGPLPVDANGTATATWEVLLADPNVSDTADFAVFYTSNGNVPPGSQPGSVALNLGPGYNRFDGGTEIPRFTLPAISRTIINVQSCATSGVTLSSSPNPATYGQAVTVTARVTGSTGTPTGTVAINDGGTTLRTLTLSAGQASFATALGTGSHALTAVYSGDGAFPAATSSVLTQVVNRAVTASTVSVPQGPGRPGQTAWFVATVTSASGTPTGSMTFRDGSTVIGTGMLDGSGTARVSANLGLGLHWISAAYNGDGNFAGSTSASQTFGVELPPISISTPGIRSGTPVAGQALTFEATVSSDNGPVTSGTISFRDGWTPLGSSGLDRSGTGSVTATLGAGNHVITASYGGDGMSGSATSTPLYLTVKGASTVTVSSSLNPAGVGAAVTFTATVAGSVAGTAPTGTVSFQDGGRALGSSAVNASGQAALTVAAGLAAGDHTITATYGGDANYTESLSAAVAQKVEKAATTTALAEGAGRNGLTLAATVAAANGSPTGTVDFMDVTAGATLGSAGLANGAASVTLAAPLPVGHGVQAVYRGDATFAGSSSAAQVLVAATNGFSFGTGFAPDAVSSLFGAGLAGSTAAATEMPLPTTLAGVTVQVVDSEGRAHAAGLYYVSPTQINFVMPGDVPAGAARLVVTTGDRTITVAILVTTVEPALASADGSGSGAAAAQVMRAHVDGAEDRLYVVLYGTGLRHASGPVSCALNGVTVAPLWMGAHSVYAGLDQINLEVPANVRGRITAACSADGVTSNSVTVMAQ